MKTTDHDHDVLVAVTMMMGRLMTDDVDNEDDKSVHTRSDTTSFPGFSP